MGTERKKIPLQGHEEKRKRDHDSFIASVNNTFAARNPDLDVQYKREVPLAGKYQSGFWGGSFTRD